MLVLYQRKLAVKDVQDFPGLSREAVVKSVEERQTT